MDSTLQRLRAVCTATARLLLRVCTPKIIVDPCRLCMLICCDDVRLVLGYSCAGLCVQKGHNVIIAAHGNTLRALMKHLDNISEKDILELNLPTG